MNRSGKRKTALLLAVCLLLGMLAGCGKKNNTQQLSANVYVPRYLDLDLDLDYVRGGCVEGDNYYVIGQVGHETTETDPISGETYTGRIYTYDIFRVSLTDGTVERLPNYVSPSVPEGRQGNANIERLETGKDGTLWVTESVYVWGSSEMWEKYPVDTIARAEADVVETETAEEEADTEDTADVEDGIASDDIAVLPVEPIEDDYQEEQTLVRRQLDGQGNELDRIDLSSLEETLAGVLGEDAYITNRTFDSEGNLYVFTDTMVYYLDPQMNVIFSLEGEDLWYDPIPLGGGMIGIQGWRYDEETDTSTNLLRTVDPEAQDWGPEYQMPSSIYNFYPGGGDYLFYYQLNDAIFGWKAGEAAEDGTGTGEGERLFSWMEADINRDTVRDFTFLPDGRVAALLMEWPEDGKGGVKTSVVIMTATPRDQLPEKTTLVYATLYLNYDSRNQILDFNKRSDKYRIEVRDYSEYVTDDNDGSAALQKLNTEILAGSVPDILDTSNLPIRQYAAKGILEDLWPFIENDPDLGRDALMTRPLEANEQDGKLYEIFNNFSIRTAVGPSKIVGDGMSWTLADMKAALEKMPEGCSILGQTDTQEDMLRLLLSLNMDRFVDWESGKCSFDGDEFKALLEFCNTFPAEWDWEKQGDDYEDPSLRVLNGRQLMLELQLSDLQWSVQEPEALFNNEFTYIGYPREDGGVGSSFVFNWGIAMTSTCADKEGAWSFIRQKLLPRAEDERYYYGNFPINKSDFDVMVKQAMEIQYETDENGEPLLDEEGNKIPVYMGDVWISEDLQVPFHATTQEEVDRVMELYNAVDSIYYYDEKIYDSVREVASQYFAGDKPLDDAARLIQSKVTLYVNESK